MAKIVLGFEAGEERRGTLKIGDVYIQIGRGPKGRPDLDIERTMRWDGLRGVPA